MNGPYSLKAYAALTQQQFTADVLAAIHQVDERLGQSEINEQNFAVLNIERTRASTTLIQEIMSGAKERASTRRWSAACEFEVEQINSGRELDEECLLGMHQILAETNGGEFRTKELFGGNGQYPEASDLPELWEIFIEEVLYGQNTHPVIKAARIYQWLVTNHFFDDANGRIARISADWILLSAGYPPLSYANDARSFVSALAGYDSNIAILRVCEGIQNSLNILTTKE